MWNISHRFVIFSDGLSDRSAWGGGLWDLSEGAGLVRAFWQINMAASHWAKPCHVFSLWWAMSSQAVQKNQFFSGVWAQGSEKPLIRRQCTSTFRYGGVHLLSVHSQVSGFQCRIPWLFLFCFMCWDWALCSIWTIHCGKRSEVLEFLKLISQWISASSP